MYRHVPNILTAARVPLTAGFGIAHTLGEPFIGLSLLLAAFVSDFFDGYLARRWHCTSAFGKEFDPYADKVTCWTVSFVILWENGWPLSLMHLVAVFLPYDIGLGFIKHFYRSEVPTAWPAKLKTTFLMVGLGLMYAAPWMPLWASALTGNPPELHLGVGVSCCWVGWVASWRAVYFALKAAAEYLRAYGFGRFIPPFLSHVL